MWLAMFSSDLTADEVARTILDTGDGVAGRMREFGVRPHLGDDTIHVTYGSVGRLLHCADLVGDFPRGLRRALCEFAHFVGDDRKSAPLFAGARGLDGGVEREQVGLFCDFMDNLDDAADGVRLFA